MADSPQPRGHTGWWLRYTCQFLLTVPHQQRNKPKEAPKPPEQAPFFLPTLPGVEPRFAVEQTKEQPQKSTRRLDKAAAEAESIFYKTLSEDDKDGDCQSFLIYLLYLGTYLFLFRRSVLHLCQVTFAGSCRCRISLAGHSGRNSTIPARSYTTTAFSTGL